MRAASVTLCLVLGVACATNLPTTTPLGEGPMVAAEAKLAKMSADGGKPEAATVASAEPEAPPEAPPPSEPEPPPIADASAPVVVTTDAGGKPGKSDAGAAASGITYAGEYIGSDDTKTKVAGAERNEHDDKAKTRVEVRPNGELAFTFVSSSDGTDICTLIATAKGKDATFAAGQPCWAGGGSNASGKLTKGSAKFDGKKLTIDMEFDLQIGPVSGTLVYRFVGNRK
jgi:hypothetical protein